MILEPLILASRGLDDQTKKYWENSFRNTRVEDILKNRLLPRRRLSDAQNAKLRDAKTLCATLMGGTPAYCSPEALRALHAKTARESRYARVTAATCVVRHSFDADARGSERGRPETCVITPATGDLWAAAVVVLELYSRSAFSRASIAAGDALDAYARKPSGADVETWDAGAVAAWAAQNGLAPEAVDRLRALGADGAWLRGAGDLSGSGFGAHRAHLARLRRSAVDWHPMPGALRKVLAAQLAPVVADRPRDAKTIVGALRDAGVGVDDVPLEARRAPPPHSDRDIRGTLGSIAAAFELRGQASLATRVHCEWIGASEGPLRREASERFARAAAALDPVSVIDLSREGRLHWKRLDNATFTALAAALDESERRPRALEALYLCRQDLLDCTLAPLAPLDSLVTLDLAWCDRIAGTLEPLEALSNLESLSLHFCVGVRGDLAPLASLRKLRDLDVGCCMELEGNLEALGRLGALTRLNVRACAKLAGTLSPLSACAELRSLDIRDTFITGSIAKSFLALEKLAVLDLKGTAVEDVGEFKRSHPKCRITGFSASRSRYRSRLGLAGLWDGEAAGETPPLPAS